MAGEGVRQLVDKDKPDKLKSTRPLHDNRTIHVHKSTGKTKYLHTRDRPNDARQGDTLVWVQSQVDQHTDPKGHLVSGKDDVSIRKCM